MFVAMIRAILGLVLALFGSPVPATHDDLPAEHRHTVGSVVLSSHFDCGSYVVLTGHLNTTCRVSYRIIEPPHLSS